MPTDPEGQGRRGGLAVFLVAFILLSLFAWQRDLYDADEGRYASVPADMVARGDWIVPRLNGLPFMDKPPLVYWVQAVPTALFHRTVFFARLPTLLAGAIWALVIFLLARAWTGSSRKAWWGALLGVTSAAGMIGSRVGPQMDMPLAAAIAVALMAGWRGILLDRRGPKILLGVAVGCGLLIKGPLVVVVPFLIALGWTVVGVPFRRVARTAFSPWAWGTALLIAAPWYVAIEGALPGWIHHFITHEHFGRFGTGDHRAFHPFWFYVPITLVYLAPWTPLAWGGTTRPLSWRAPWRALAGLVRCSPWGPRPWSAALPGEVDVGGERPVRVARLAWTWFLVAFVFYSLSTRKLLNYLLPAALPLFVLVGARFDGVLQHRAWHARWLPLLVGIGMVALGGLMAAGLFFPFATGRLPSSVEASRWAPGGLPLMLGGLLLLGGLFLWARARLDRTRGMVLIGCVACGWWLVDWSLARIEDVGSARQLASAIRTTGAERSDMTVALKRYPQGLGFYGAPPIWIAGGTPEHWAQREIVNPYARDAWEAAGGPDVDPAQRRRRGFEGGLLTSRQFERLWASETAVLVICRWGEIAHLGGEIVGGPYAGAGRTDLFLLLNHAKGAPARPRPAAEAR